MDELDIYDLDPDVEIPIDPEELEIECIRQPSLYLKYARAAADGEKLAKEAHEKLKQVRSELVKDAWEDPDECLGLKKATKDTVEAYYRSHEDYIEAKQDWIQAEYERDVLNGAKWAVSGRKDSIEGLIKLAVMGWYATPATPRSMKDLHERMDERGTIEMNNKVRSASKGKKKKGMTRKNR